MDVEMLSYIFYENLDEIIEWRLFAARSVISKYS